MAEKNPAYQRYPKQILGDNLVLSMDWDAYGMHNWLLDISFQENPPGTIPDDQAVVRRWLRSPSDDVWRRVWPQLKTAWPILADGRRGNKGMMRTCERQRAYSESRSEAAKARWNKDDDAYALRMDMHTPCESTEDEDVLGSTKELKFKIRNPSDSEIVYCEYPRKVGKRKALDSIESAIKRLVSGESKVPMNRDDATVFLIQRTQLFAKSPAGNAGTYTPHPTTWFNQSRYLDDESEWSRKESPHGTSHGTSQQATVQSERRATNREAIIAGLTAASRSMAGHGSELLQVRPATEGKRDVGKDASPLLLRGD